MVNDPKSERNIAAGVLQPPPNRPGLPRLFMLDLPASRRRWPTQLIPPLHQMDGSPINTEQATQHILRGEIKTHSELSAGKAKDLHGAWNSSQSN